MKNIFWITGITLITMLGIISNAFADCGDFSLVYSGTLYYTGETINIGIRDDDDHLAFVVGTGGQYWNWNASWPCGYPSTSNSDFSATCTGSTQGGPGTGTYITVGWFDLGPGSHNSWVYPNIGWNTVFDGTYNCCGTSGLRFKIQLTICPDDSRPDEPSVSTKCNYVRVSWDVTEGAAGYNVERDPAFTSGGSIHYFSSSTTRLDDNSVEMGTGYEYRVQMVAPTGCTSSSWSTWSDQAGKDNPGAPAPTNFRATLIRTDSIRIAWDFDEDSYMFDEEYEVYRSLTTTRLTSTIATPSTEYYLNTGLSPATNYYYWVRAKTACNDGAYAGPLLCTTLTPLMAPTTVRATRYGCDSVYVVWSDVAEADSFRIYRGPSAVFPAPDTIATRVVDTFYYDNSADPANNMYYWVQSVRGTNLSTESVPDSATIFPLPGSIASITATADTLLNDRIHLIWRSAVNAVYYKIHRADVEHGTYTIIDSTFAPDTTHTDSIGLGAEDDYFYFVTPYNICSIAGTASDTAWDSTICFPPAPPTLTATAYPDSVVLEWPYPGDADNFVLIRAFFGSTDYDTVYNGPLETYTDNGVINDSTYNYKVCAVTTECGAGGFCDPVMVHVPIGGIAPPDWATLHWWREHSRRTQFQLDWQWPVIGADGYIRSFSRTRGGFYENITTGSSPLERPPFIRSVRALQPGDPYYAYVRTFMEYGIGDTIISITTDTVAACRPVGGHNLAIPKEPLGDAIFYNNGPRPTFKWYRSTDIGVTNYKVSIYNVDMPTELLNSGMLSPSDSSWMISLPQWNSLGSNQYDWTISTCYGAGGCFKPFTRLTFRKADSTDAVIGGEIGGVPIDTSDSPEIDVDLYSDEDSRSMMFSPTTFTSIAVRPSGSYSLIIPLPPLPPPPPPTHHRAVIKPNYSTCEYMEFPTFTAADAMLLRRFLNGNIHLSPTALGQGDVDGNGIINTLDVNLINSRAVGAIGLFSAGEWFFEPESISVTFFSEEIITGNDFFAGLFGDIDGSCYFGTSGIELPETEVISEAILTVGDFSGNVSDVIIDSIIFRNVVDSDSSFTPDSIGSFTLHISYDPSMLTMESIYPSGLFAAWNWTYNIDATDGIVSFSCYCANPIATPTNIVLAKFNMTVINTGMAEIHIPYWELTDFEGIPAFGYTKYGFSNPALGIGEGKVQLPNLSEVYIVPNPFNASFVITFTSTSNANLEVLDITGRQLYGETFKNDSGQPSKVIWNSSDHISEIASGIYFVRIISDKIEINRKVTCIK